LQNSGLAGKEDELKFTKPDYELSTIKNFGQTCYTGRRHDIEEGT
jgi:hypothetical protein